MKNKFDDSGVKVDYVEEVNENQLYDKKDRTDIIYSKSYLSTTRNVVLIIFMVLLLLISLFSLIFGFVYFNKHIDNGDTYTLFVVHSNDEYGGKQISFDEYNSFKNSYSYDFSVKNSNEVKLNYKIQIENTNFSSNNADYSKINYSLLNYNNVISEGKIINDNIFDVVSLDIEPNQNQQLVLKLWSDDVNQNLIYSFKINILV